MKNFWAYWIPELTVTEVISGTIYTVTGSYEGTESFVRKLERITAPYYGRRLDKKHLMATIPKSKIPPRNT